MQLSVSKKNVEHAAFADELQLVTLTNSHGLEVVLSNYGASIWSVKLYGKDEQPISLSLGYQDIKDWATNPYYFGITAGRVANRIGKAQFPLAGKTIQLVANEGNNQLHGGPKGLSHCTWQVETLQDSDSVAAVFSITSPDGDQGFPGNLSIQLAYRLKENNELILSYHATCDQTTPVCLTNHAYWNLASNKQQGILEHELTIHASHILALDNEQIPTGELILVDDSAYDFKQPKAIAADIKQLANGYDHYFVMDKNPDNKNSLQTIAVLKDPLSGRELEISTTEVGVQFYSGNFLDGSHIDDEGYSINQFHGLCLETHGYPNAVNIDHFPSIMFEANTQYQQITVHKFKNI
ncbi:aldose epimerase family protein [Shewanella xiamenensis]|uniref:aldose epimerase family protein n=1 Tax=Shewanella xiamenensis TaxID=332186 RepID=UPI00313DCA23